MPRKKTEVLSQDEITRAATNAPELSDNEVVLGTRTFKIVDLPYDDYIVFLSELRPLLEAVAARFGGASLVSNEELTVSTLLKYCADALPRMVQLSLRQTEPGITVDEVKVLCKSPFKAANVVLAQMRQNQTVSEIADFFAQLVPMIRTGRQQLMTEETPLS